MPTATEVIKGILYQHAESKARRGLPSLLVMGRNTDGTAQTRNDDGECIGRSRTDAFIGQRIRSVDNSMLDVGTSGISLNSRRGSRPLLWVESLDPRDLPTGETTTVTITGWGFSETTVFDFLLPGTSDVHPDITQVEQRFVDAFTVEIDVLVAAAAELFEDAPLAYDDPARPF